MQDPRNRVTVPTPPSVPGPARRPPSDPGRDPQRADDARHECGDLSFQPPAGWRNVTVFTAQGPALPGSRIVPLIRMAREPMRGTTLRLHADNVLMKLGKEVAGFELVESGLLEVAGRSAITMRFHLKGEAGTLEQILVMVDPMDDPDRGVATFNASGPEEQSGAIREMLGGLLRSVRFRDRHSDPGTAPALAPPLPPIGRADPGMMGVVPTVPMPGYRANR